MVGSLEYPKNSTFSKEEVILMLLITCPGPQKNAGEMLNSVPIGSKVFPARDRPESRNTVD